MQLTRHADYALRLLVHLAGVGGARLQIADVAAAQAISRTHLMKIANELARGGFIEAMRGRGGGVWLARDPADIRLGDVVRAMEPCGPMVDCTSCRLAGGCGLPAVLHKAASAFHAVLDDFTLADILDRPGGAFTLPRAAA